MYIAVHSPSKPLTSNSRPVDRSGVAAKGQNQLNTWISSALHLRNLPAELTFALPPIPALIFDHMPISYGNSCFLIRIWIPPGPDRYPPKCRARLSKVSCRSISHDSIVVVLRARDQMLRRRRINNASHVKLFTTNTMKRWTSCPKPGPRY